MKLCERPLDPASYLVISDISYQYVDTTAVNGRSVGHGGGEAMYQSLG